MSQHTEGAVGASLAQQSDTASASVVGNTLIAFTDDVDAQHKTELLYLLGYVQLMGVQAGHDPKSDPMGYYNYVTTMLDNIGFQAQDPEFRNYSTPSSTVELDHVVMDVLGGVTAAPELAVAQAALAALQSTSTDEGGPWDILSSHAGSEQNGSFAVGVASQPAGPSGDGSVRLVLGVFCWNGSLELSDFLWVVVPTTSLGLKVADITVTVKDDLWNQPGVGSAISMAMGSHSAGYIAELPALHMGT